VRCRWSARRKPSRFGRSAARHRGSPRARVSALALGARGFKRLSLNFAAWGRLLDSAEDAGLSGRLQRLFAKGLNPFFQIQSLRDFNQKFAPEWVPRSVVIDDISDLPRVALLYASVEGFLEIPLLSRVLEPPIRQRVDAAQPRP
jgi:lysyl-tRNA synthetase, class II